MSAVPPFDAVALDEVAARLDLRDPNKDAVQTAAMLLERHYATSKEPFEAVLDVATGVGKTYIMAAAIDYFAEMGVRNFAIIAPGQTILQKTIDQFTPGNAKSLLGGMAAQPVLITADNFRTAAMRAAMDDPTQVKLFVFSVQALLKPSTKVGRRTHAFQEGLGTAFYTHLDELDDLIVFADEHHCYYAPAFSKAIRELTPLALLGLTGTPHKKTPPEQIIYRYPLTAAIADELVKTPVVVGRRDDLTDELSQLLDGVSILEAKQAALDGYCAREGCEAQHAIMLVNCKDIDHAEEVGALIAADSFFGGRYRDAVLVVHSEKSDEALAALASVEDPDSPVRIIVQVGMLKEGWDVKSVYVVCSLRALVSDILTEQTMGRGLRLPFGRYTGWGMLDTLDVLAHEKYEQVLARAGALNEAFIDYRTVLKTTVLADGREVVVPEREVVQVEVVEDDGAGVGGDDAPQPGDPTRPHVVVTNLDSRKREAARPSVVSPRTDVGIIEVPVVRTVSSPGKFSLAQIHDLRPYRELGERVATAPDKSLRRMRIGAQRIAGKDGEQATQLAPSQAADVIESQVPVLSLDEAKARIVLTIRESPVVPSYKSERVQVERLLGAVEAGAGAAAPEIFTRYPERVASEVVRLLVAAQSTLAPPLLQHEDVSLAEFAPRARPGRETTSTDHVGEFSRGTGYIGWGKSLYPEASFDSKPERNLAVLADGSPEVKLWVRLMRDDLPLLWKGGARRYNPDFLVVDAQDDKWLVEVKADNATEDQDVQAKRAEALTWANHVNGANLGAGEWNYLLAPESDIDAAKGSWSSLVAATKA